MNAECVSLIDKVRNYMSFGEICRHLFMNKNERCTAQQERVAKYLSIICRERLMGLGN